MTSRERMLTDLNNGRPDRLPCQVHGWMTYYLQHYLGADGLETMTPPSIGGDCDLREASRRVGDKLFFIGGFDQNAGFERGTPAEARRLVIECFEATRDHAGDYRACNAANGAVVDFHQRAGGLREESVTCH